LVDAKRDICHGGQATPAYFVFVFKHLAYNYMYLLINNNKNNIHVLDLPVVLNLTMSTWIEGLSHTENITGSISLH
jgi:hypothetical protein